MLTMTTDAVGLKKERCAMKITTVCSILLAALAFGGGCATMGVGFEETYTRNGDAVSSTVQVKQGAVVMTGYPEVVVEADNIRIMTPLHNPDGTPVYSSDGRVVVRVDSMIYRWGKKVAMVGRLRTGDSCWHLWTSIGFHTLEADVWLVQDGRRSDFLGHVSIPFVVHPGWRDPDAPINHHWGVKIYPPPARWW